MKCFGQKHFSVKISAARSAMRVAYRLVLSSLSMAIAETWALAQSYLLKRYFSKGSAVVEL